MELQPDLTKATRSTHSAATETTVSVSASSPQFSGKLLTLFLLFSIWSTLFDTGFRITELIV